MSDIGGAGASSKGADQQQYPYFTSSGGVTPEQTALADYDFGQNLTQGQAQFEGSDAGGGPSLSTMASQVAGGANIGKAINLAGLSDTNQGAELGAFDNAINIDQQNNAASLASTEQETQQAGQIATSLGKLATA